MINLYYQNKIEIRKIFLRNKKTMFLLRDCLHTCDTYADQQVISRDSDKQFRRISKEIFNG